MKAITVKYIGPSETRFSRLVATDSDGNRVTMPYPHEMSHDDGRKEAAKRLVRKMGWGPCTLAMGGTKDGEVFVMIPAEAFTILNALDPTNVCLCD